MKFPKILILNQPFDYLTGGGITLTNLFDGWNPYNLAVVCSAQLISASTDFNICKNYYQLGVLEQKWNFPFNLIRSDNFSGPIDSKATNYDKIDLRPISQNIKTNIVNNYFMPFIKYSGIYQSVYSLNLSSKLIDWIHLFKPDIIYAQAQSYQEIKFCLNIRKILNIPMIFHMMDDWISLGSQSSLSVKLWKKKTDNYFKELLLSSNQILTISDYMSHEYLARYGLRSNSFHNPVDLDFWKRHQKKSFDVGFEPEILYAGRIGLGIDSSLLTMAIAVKEINQTTDSNIRFVLQTESIPIWVDQFDCVVHRELVPYESLPIVFSQADLLFLPYDFSKESLKFIQFSMPTKASEYMICGTPILISAPEETAIVKYAEKYQWAKVVTENNLDVFKSALKDVMFNTDLRKRISTNAVHLSETQHSKHIVQERFYKLLVDSMNSSYNAQIHE